MRKKFFCGAIFLLFALTIIFSGAASAATWRLDGTDANSQPRSFRMMTDDWHEKFSGKEPTRQGLDRLKISASGQPSQKYFSTLYKKLKKFAAPGKKIYIVDLRQESHGFVNNFPVSWHEKGNAANLGKTSEEIEKLEAEQLKTLLGKTQEFVPLGNYDIEHLKPVTLKVKKISTEREAAKAAGFEYVRFSATDMTFPDVDAVEDFFSFLHVIDKDDWLHFHCHAGHGRTTIFATMKDIFVNPEVPFEEICQRQYLLGGTNLLANENYAKNIKLFYDYVQAINAKTFGGTWREFLATRNHTKK